MDGILYTEQSSISGDSLEHQDELVTTSESSSTTYYSTQQHPYIPTMTHQQNDQLPTTTTVLESSTLSLFDPTDHEKSRCTTNIIINQEPDTHTNTVGLTSTPNTIKQKCTRCKRWKMLDQFQSGGANPHTFVGCLECRDTAKKYGQSEFGKVTRRNYNQTAKAKETRKKYAQSEKGKESRKKYSQTKRAKETRKKYNQSEKAKEARRKRALVKSGSMQEENQGEEKVRVECKKSEALGNGLQEPTTFEISSDLTHHVTFDPSNGKMTPMESAFWQTVTKTVYDQARRQHSTDMDGHDKFEVDIQLKYRRTR